MRKTLNVRRKESSIWGINKGFYLKEMSKKNRISKTRKSVRKVSKIQGDNEFK